MFSNIGTTELIIIGVVLMILFGTKKIPELARGLGEASTEFKKGLQGEEEKKKESNSKTEDDSSKKS